MAWAAQLVHMLVLGMEYLHPHRSMKVLCYIILLCKLCEGTICYPSVHRVDFAGQDVSIYLAKLLARNSGRRFTTSYEINHLVASLKEKESYVALDVDTELSRHADPKSYTLPDGSTISVGNETCQCAELLFQPGMIDRECMSLPELCYESIMKVFGQCYYYAPTFLKCPVDLRKDCFNSIILAGGASLTRGLAERLAHEMTALAPGSAKIHVSASPDRANLAWTGSKFCWTTCNNKRWLSSGLPLIFPKLSHKSW